MRYIHVLRDIAAVIAESYKHSVYAVIGSESDQRVVILPTSFDFFAEFDKGRGIAVECVARSCRRGPGAVYRVVVAQDEDS